MNRKEEVKMKDYCVDVNYTTSLRISLPEGTDIDKIDRECRNLDEYMNDPDSSFEFMIKEYYDGEVLTGNWYWKTHYLGIEELREDEYKKSYKGEWLRNN